METLKTLRKSKNLTLEQEAEILKTSSQVLSRYERGDREPDCDMLKSFAKFYNVSIDFLLTGKDRKSTRLNSSHIEPSRMPSSA